MKQKKVRLIYLIIPIFFILVITIILFFMRYLNSNILITTGKEMKLEQSEYQLVDDENIKMEISENKLEKYDNKYEEISQEVLEEVKKENINIHIDPTTGIKYVTYEDFEVYADGKHDDYEAIMKTHIYANDNDLEVRAQNKEYHIFREDEYIPIPIKTNTNWNNATLVLHDENISAKKTKDYPLFQILSFEKEQTIRERNILDEITINKQTNNIPELSGYGNCVCMIYNDNRKQFIRYGENQNSGNSQQDIFKIDNKGNVLNEIQWDFDYISRIVLIPIPKEELEIKNANFITILPQEGREQERGYYNRNIICYRSNTKIRNINHNLDKEESLGGPYYGFLRVEKCSDVLLENCKLTAHKYKQASNYDLIIEYATDIEMNKVTQENLEDANRWGITGTNYTKDIIYKNCKLNRVDAHSGVHNLTIENSIVGDKGITVVGSGELNIINTTILSKQALINLRSDYEATWERKYKYQRLQYATI